MCNSNLKLKFKIKKKQLRLPVLVLNAAHCFWQMCFGTSTWLHRKAFDRLIDDDGCHQFVKILAVVVTSADLFA